MPQMAPSMWLLLATTIFVIAMFKINNMYFSKQGNTKSRTDKFTKNEIKWLW